MKFLNDVILTGAGADLTAPATVTFSGLSATTETNAVVVNSSGVLSKRALGSNAFNSTTIPTGVVFTTGNQTIAGVKTFSNNLTVGGIIMDGNTVTGIDDSSEFTDDDAHIMTSAAINDRFATYNWVNSRGENLFSNGSGLLGDITNMPGFTFDGSHANNSPGSFKWTGTGTPFTSEAIPVDASRKYKMQYDAKTENGVGRYYGFTSCFDVDGNSINASNHMYRANTLTTLAVQLVYGATTMTLTDSANWNNSGTAGSSNHLRSLIRWDYANSFGYTYPAETYSRNYLSQAWDPGDINFTTHVVTLRVPWAGGTIPAGTKVSNGSSGGTYKYNVMSNKLLTTDWVRQDGYMDGVDYSGTNNSSKFPPGTAKIKLGWLMNYNNLQAGEVAWFTNINVGVAAHEDDEIAQAVERATDSNTFTDADHTKLNAIEASATADQTVTNSTSTTSSTTVASATAVKAAYDRGSLGITNAATNAAIPTYKTTSSANASVGPGWITVASNNSDRKHGEIIVSDGESSDHAFIRIDWLRSYADTNFSVLNVGGHANRITGVRVLNQTSDVTYGTKLLQVYVTVQSNYYVKANTVGVPYSYVGHTAVTPVVENTKTGYALQGNQIEDLQDSSLAAEQGISVGGNSVFGGTIGSGAITSTGQITGTELEGTSLDINGNADISGNLTFKPLHYGVGDDLDSDSRTIWSSHRTDGSTANRPINYSSIYTLGGSTPNALQISTNEDYSESGMWIRQHNSNSASPQGVGWQNWTEVWTTNKISAITDAISTTSSTVVASATAVKLAYDRGSLGVNTAGAAQGTANSAVSLGNAALPKAGGAMTGAITTNSTFDGVDIATRDAVLTSTTTTANAALPKAGGEMTGALTINLNGDALNLRSTTNGQPANITFSTNVPDSQIGHIKYSHSNSASYGGGDSFTIGGTETTTVILADGQLMYKDGIYSKPASGTGAGTRKDASWDTAYTHSQTAHAPAGATVNSSNATLLARGNHTGTQSYDTISNPPTIPSGNAILDWTTDRGTTNIHTGNYINTTYNKASSTVLGLVKVGSGLAISGAGVLSAAVAAEADEETGGTMSSEDKIKLNAIEGEADVTDATNVAAAGASMKSATETISGNKTFSSTIAGSINGNSATTSERTITSGEISAISTNTSKVGITTGTQTIAGAKTFSTQIIGQVINLGSSSGYINRTAAQFATDGTDKVYIGSNNYGWNDARDYATNLVDVDAPVLDQNDQHCGIICPVNVSQVSIMSQVRMNSANSTMQVRLYKMARATAVITTNLTLTLIASATVSTLSGRMTTLDATGSTAVSAGDLIIVGFGKTDGGAGQKPRLNFTLTGTTS